MKGALPSHRLHWPDFARGLCIVLVVSAHITSQLFVHLDISYQTKEAWLWFNKGFAPVRLPLFFLISGFLSAAAIQKSWQHVVASRVLFPYYVYIIWAIPLPLIYAALDSSVHYGRIDTIWDALKVLLIPNSSLWYLYALAAYFVIAKSLVRVPRFVVLFAILAVSMASATWGGESVIASAGSYPVFYILGAYFPVAIRAVVNNRHRATAIVALFAYTSVLATYVLGWQNFAGIRTICGLIGAGAGLVFISRAAGSLGWASQALETLGRETLPLYILHYPILALLSIPLTPLAGILPTIVEWVLPAVLLALVIPASLLTHRLLIRLQMGLLFRLPKRVVTLIH